MFISHGEKKRRRGPGEGEEEEDEKGIAIGTRDEGVGIETSE